MKFIELKHFSINGLYFTLCKRYSRYFIRLYHLDSPDLYEDKTIDTTSLKEAINYFNYYVVSYINWVTIKPFNRWKSFYFTYRREKLNFSLANSENSYLELEQKSNSHSYEELLEKYNNLMTKYEALLAKLNK